MTITVYDKVFGESLKTPTYVNGVDCLKKFKTGEGFSETIAEIRELAKDKDKNKEQITELKKSLPVAFFCGEFKDNPVKKNFLKHSGLLVLDFDNIDIAKLKEQFKKRTFTFACFEGPSGNGLSLKVLIRIPKVKDDAEYQLMFKFFQDRMPQLDASGKNINRACFYSHDPEIYINENATEFELPKGYFYTMSHPDKRLLSVCEKILKAPRGESHMAVLSASYTVGGIVAGGLIAESVAIRALEDAADARRPNEQRDSRMAIHSAFNEGKAKPLYDDESISSAVQKFSRPRKTINISNVIVSDDDMDEKIGKFYDGTMELGRGIGVVEFDHFIRFRQNAFYYMVGKKGGGKTTIMLYLLLLDAVKNNSRYLICGIENSPHALRNQLVSFYLQDSAKYVYEHNRVRYESAKKFISERFVFLKYDDDWILSDILDVANQLHKENPFNAIMIDPYNAIRVPNSSNSFQYHVDCANACRQFSDKHFSVFLTGHPTSSKQREGTAPKDVDGEGGGTFPNKAHVTLAIHRDVGGEGDAKHTTDLSVGKVREKELFGGNETMDNFPIRLVFDWRKYGFKAFLPLPEESGYSFTPRNLLD